MLLDQLTALAARPLIRRLAPEVEQYRLLLLKWRRASTRAPPPSHAPASISAGRRMLHVAARRRLLEPSTRCAMSRDAVSLRLSKALRSFASRCLISSSFFLLSIDSTPCFRLWFFRSSLSCATRSPAPPE